MLKFHAILLMITLSSVMCSKDAEDIQDDDSIVNTKHLKHLYEKIEVSNTELGTIWIYSDAPDYNLIADSDEGYTCVDDVARALVFYCRQYKINPDNENLEKVKSLAKFVMYMKAYNGYYFNFMFPDKQINTTHQNSIPGPNFWAWRAYWGLSELSLLNSAELVDIQTEANDHLFSLTQKIEELFQDPYNLIEVEGLTMPSWMEDYGSDQISVIILGLTNYYKLNPDENIKNLIQKLGESIITVQYGDEETFPHGAFLSWKNIWHAWGSAQSYALLKAGNELNNESFIDHALLEIDHFYSYAYEQGYLHEFHLRMISDTIQVYNLKKFPQIAYGLNSMILATIEAYHVTNSDQYALQAGQLGSWYFGNNAANQTMYSTSTGRCFDGIDSESGVNMNSGAESTIEALLSMQAIETSSTALQIIKVN